MVVLRTNVQSGNRTQEHEAVDHVTQPFELRGDSSFGKNQRFCTKVALTFRDIRTF
jgi:hypothetical protein